MWTRIRFLKRAIRKDAVLCDEWIITSDKAFFENSAQERPGLFEAAKDYFAENYGEQNIAYASVHMDESTPHMHLGIVPMRDSKLSSKLCLTVKSWKDTGWVASVLERARIWVRARARNSEAKHLTVAEFKQEIAYKEIEQELVLDFGAQSMPTI